MSEFADNFAAHGLPSLTEHLGSPCVYVDLNGAETSVTGPLSPQRTEERQTTWGSERVRTRTFLIATDPASVYGGVADPVEQATVKIGGDPWSVERVESLGNAVARLHLVRRGSMSHIRQRQG